MTELAVVELKAFVPAKDYARSLAFYRELGFELAWDSGELAYLRAGSCAFLLQRFYVEAHASNFMMHLLVEDVDAWWAHVRDAGLAERYGVRATPPEDRPWGIRDFTLDDPTGVLWRIGQNLSD